MNRKLHIALWVVQGLLALVFLASGIQKLVVPVSGMIAKGATMFEGREWLWPFIGVSELLEGRTHRAALVVGRGGRKGMMRSPHPQHGLYPAYMHTPPPRPTEAPAKADSR